MTVQTCPAVFLSAHDGDTVHLDVMIAAAPAFHEEVWRRGYRYRLARINAPELSTEAGKVAAAALVAFCAAQPIAGWQIVTSKQDPYGRYIAEVIAPDGTNLSDWMVAQKQAVPVAYKIERNGSLRAVDRSLAFDVLDPNVAFEGPSVEP